MKHCDLRKVYTLPAEQRKSFRYQVASALISQLTLSLECMKIVGNATVKLRHLIGSPIMHTSSIFSSISQHDKLCSAVFYIILQDGGSKWF